MNLKSKRKSELLSKIELETKDEEHKNDQFDEIEAIKSELKKLKMLDDKKPF